jgi:hypothetical protein
MCGPRLAKSGDLRQINAARFGLDLDAATSKYDVEPVKSQCGECSEPAIATPGARKASELAAPQGRPRTPRS